jgi:hypothetical protein
VAAGVAVFAAGIVVAGALHRGSAPAIGASVSPAICARLPADLDALWSPTSRRALLASNPAATISTAWLADVIDYYALAWPAQRRAACVTRLSDRAWSPALLDNAAGCLADRRDELVRAAAAAHQPADAVVSLAMGLRDPRQCGDLLKMAQLVMHRAAPEPVDAGFDPRVGAGVGPGAGPGARPGTDAAPGPDPELTINAALAQAQQLADAHQLDPAIAAIERALPAIRNAPDPRYLTDYTRALDTKAHLELLAGHPAAALATAGSGLVVQERIYGTDHPQLRSLLDAIAQAQHALGQADAARATQDRAQRIAR